MGNQPSGHHNGDTQKFWSDKSLSKKRTAVADNTRVAGEPGAAIPHHIEQYDSESKTDMHSESFGKKVGLNLKSTSNDDAVTMRAKKKG